VTSKINRGAHKARLVARVQECYSPLTIHPSIHVSNKTPRRSNRENKIIHHLILFSRFESNFHADEKKWQTENWETAGIRKKIHLIS
jgi:hypothetical protein